MAEQLKTPPIRPLGDFIAILRDKPEEKVGTIVLPNQAQVKPTQGYVVAVGRGKVLENGTRRPLETRPGDYVTFREQSGIEIKVEGEVYLLLPDSEVVAILNPEEETEDGGQDVTAT